MKYLGRVVAAICLTSSLSAFSSVHDFGAGVGVPTSSTRPGSGNSDGDLLFDTNEAEFYGWDGTDWRNLVKDAGWQTYTPGCSLQESGTCVLAGRYRVVGKTVEVQLRGSWSSAASVSGSLSNITFPAGLTPAINSSTAGRSLVGRGTFFDYLSTEYPVFCRGNYSTYDKMHCYVMNTAGTYGVHATITPTVPVTIADSDFIEIYISYEI